MARRKTYQKGSVQLRNGEWTLRYREYDHHKNSWALRREQLGRFKNKKEARRVADSIMAGVNQRNNGDRPAQVHLETTFRQFVQTRWRAYSVSAKHQVSTKDCYDSPINHRVLPHFGERLLTEITPSDISEFLL